ncbi:CBM35 domain-containing protein [Nonomuraea jiangxiensis]|uniref:Carbohydrate binding module (Family 35) n=1 Tax=Nonomuraea jiangxiensis TaxID=633440 RepID=A0A1G7ZLJ9_9ACTN|nr:CBM35 domain-containing protein [Nonomuraea jiangxiensis]SDH09612.1 Carbohydrate binding module (family 35) [Nonomuraea jiangxiensis]
MNKRLGGVLAALALTTTTLALPAPAGADAAWTLRWSPNPANDTVAEAFEGIEDDRSDSHPGTTHIYVSGDAYRFDMHTQDRDGDDRQRNEVKGMRTSSSSYLEIRENETWRISYQMYIPTTLDSTTSFTHIAQMKTPGSGAPLYTMSLPISGGTPKINVRYWDEAEQTHEVGNTNLGPIQGKWVDTTFEFKASDDGYLRWILRDGSTTLVDRRLDDTDLWRGDDEYLRPKWGIYRSIESSGLQNTYLLVRNLRGEQLTGDGGDPSDPSSVEAEQGSLSGTARTTSCSGCSGGTKVGWLGNGSGNAVTLNVQSSAAGDRQLTVHGLVSGTRSFQLSVNGGTPQTVSLTGTSWNDPVTRAVQVRLNAGANSVRLYNDSASAPDLDRITLQ